MNQLIYLLTDCLIGNFVYSAGDIADVGSKERALHFHNQGTAIAVYLAVEVAEEIAGLINELTDEEMVFVQFVNRVRNFPLDLRTPEWETLVKRIDNYFPKELQVNPVVKKARKAKKETDGITNT